MDKIDAHFKLDEELTKMIRQNLVFINPPGTKYSFFPSDRFALLKFRLPNLNCPVFNYTSHLKYLLSPSTGPGDTGVWESTFLDGTELFDLIAFTSFPRSGNSMVRKHLQDITGIYTGDHTTPTFTCDLQLELNGLAGLGLADHRAWIIKSHTPMNHNFEDFVVNKMICCIRNPYDTIMSRLSFACSWAHSKRIMCEDTQKNMDYIIDYGYKSIDYWVKFHDWWIVEAKKMNIPVYFFRYEDVIKKPEETYTGIFEFILGHKIADDSVLKKRIHSFK